MARKVADYGIVTDGQITLGSSASNDFQEVRFNLDAPVMFRVNRSHFGPTNRREAELHPSCEVLLQGVEKGADTQTPYNRFSRPAVLET